MCRILPIGDKKTRRVQFAPLPAPAPGKPLYIYKGRVPREGPYLYLFPKDPPGVIRWDTRSDRGELVRFPYGDHGPWGGTLSQDGKTLWCPLWDANAMARFDLEKLEWTGHWPTP